MKILIVLAKVTGTLAADAQFGGTLVTVTDDVGTAQQFTLTGTETPPFSVTADVLDGHAGTVTAQDVDTKGAAVAPLASATYDSTGTGGGSVGDSFPQTSSIAITLAT